MVNKIKKENLFMNNLKKKTYRNTSSFIYGMGFVRFLCYFDGDWTIYT